jgi:hypothetical protein
LTWIGAEQGGFVAEFDLAMRPGGEDGQAKQKCGMIPFLIVRGPEQLCLQMLALSLGLITAYSY